jgi:hypothetical protein
MICGVLISDILTNIYLEPLLSKYLFKIGYIIIMIIVLNLVIFNEKIPRINIPT